MSSGNPDQTPTEYDPVFIHSRREALIILCLWVACLVYAVPYCYINGYSQEVDPAQLETVVGIPAWVFWGIAFPWILATLFTIFFCLFVMRDDDLGTVSEGHDRQSAAPKESHDSRTKSEGQGS